MTMQIDLPGDLMPQQIVTKPGEIGPMKLGRLKKTHPRLNVQRVRMLKAMLRGGHHLLADPDVMSVVFPKYTYETDATYQERCRRAYYENVFGLLMNQISAGLAQDPVQYVTEVNEDTKVAKEPDEYWLDLLDDAGPPSEDGSGKKSLDEILRGVCVEALTCGWAWVQTELPEALPEDDENFPTSLLEQEEAGGLRAYLVPWCTDMVTDWEERRGKLLWLRTYQCEQVAENPAASRDDKKHVWTIWTPTEWIRYEYVQKKNESPKGDEDVISPAKRGAHSFKRVPFSRLDFCAPNEAQLWVGDQIESICRQYFNRQNGEAFQWTQYNYQQLYEFLAPEVAGIDTPISEAQMDPQRAQRRRAPGMVHVRGADDKAQFIGPNMQGADVGAKATVEMRDAIFRVVQQMALAQDTSGAMLRRSAESKKVDSQGTEILLGAIGIKVVTLANNLRLLLAAGREDATVEPPEMKGYAKFSILDVDAIIARAVDIETANIPSATYQIEQKYQLAVAHLGPETPPETLVQIREELEEAITQDQFTGAMLPDPADNPFGEDDEEVDPEEKAEDEEFAKEDEEFESFFKKGKDK